MVARAVAGALSFCVPFSLAFGFISNQFLNSGTVFLDAGWFADLMFQPDWRLPNPDVMRVGDNPVSFYGVHFSPILAIVSQLARVLPLDRVSLFAAYMGAAHGLLGLTMLYVLSRRLDGAFWLTVAAGISIAFGLNGIALNITTYPHYEALAPGLVLLSLAFLIEKRLVPAWIVGAFAVAVREDVGFHFVAILGPLVVVEFVRIGSIKPQRHMLAFAAACLAYSIAAIVCQKQFFATNDTFGLVYAGNDWFAHLTGDLIERRLALVFDERVHIWLTIVALLGMAAVTSNAYAAIGAVAFLPWLALHLVAYRDGAGTLSIHYPFPLIIGVGWAAIAYVHFGSQHSRRSRCVAATCLGLVVGSTYVSNDAVRAFFLAAVPRGFASDRGPTIRFANALTASLPVLGNIKVDTSVMSLAPTGLSPDAWLWPRDWNDRGPSTDTDVTVYLHNGIDQAMVAAQVAAMGPVVLYSVPGTNIRVASKGIVNLHAPIAPLLQRER